MVKNGSSHDYPFYKNLEKELDEAIGYKFKQYVSGSDKSLQKGNYSRPERYSLQKSCKV